MCITGSIVGFDATVNANLNANMDAYMDATVAATVAAIGRCFCLFRPLSGVPRRGPLVGTTPARIGRASMDN